MFSKDLNIKMEFFSEATSDVDEAFLEDLLVKKKPRTRKPRTPPSESDSSFCILCLRKCPPGSEITFCSKRESNTTDVTEAEHKLTAALDLPMKLQNRTMCPTCWQLIELITDFKQCCEKAAKKMKVLAKGLDYDQQSDLWMAKSTLTAIKLTHQMVRKHLVHLDEEETKAKRGARQNRAKRTNVESKVELTPESVENAQEEAKSDS